MIGDQSFQYLTMDDMKMKDDSVHPAKVITFLGLFLLQTDLEHNTVIRTESEVAVICSPGLKKPG